MNPQFLSQEYGVLAIGTHYILATNFCGLLKINGYGSPRIKLNLGCDKNKILMEHPQSCLSTVIITSETKRYENKYKLNF